MKIAALALTLAVGTTAWSQTPAPVVYPVRTFHLTYTTSQAEQNEILTALRNMLTPGVRIFLVPSRSEIVITGPADQIQLTEELLPKLDTPQKSYRVSYTFTEMDGGKRIGVQHFTMTLVPGQRVQMKEGSRVPVVTGSTGDAGKSSRQNTYVDVGLNFDSTLDSYGPDGVRLQSKIERSAVAEEKSSVGTEDPVIRQTLLAGVNTLTLGKPTNVGSIDIAGSTRRLEVEALVEAAK